jgi:crotonobetainyl-CoA:carnitine CoA-transferase CaiB-like acyl-CoA transferase
MTTICDGLLMLEIGSGSIAAALCGMVLADNGARVVKLEPPEGDRLRRESPSGFLVWCRDKESVVIDLRTGAGRDRYLALAQSADVIVEALAPGVAAAWGVDYPVLRETNPRLVYCSITAFGAAGSYARLKGYEGVVAAKSGLFTAGTYTGRPTGSDPVFVNAPLASVGAGHMALSGVLAALTARETTGRGQCVEATLVQGLTPSDYFATMHWQYELRRAAEPPAPRAVPLARPPALLCSKDGRWINVSTTMPHQLRSLVKALEITVTRPSAADAVAATEYRDAFYDAFRQKTLEEWLPLLLADTDIAFEVVRTSEQGMDHPQAVHNRQVIQLNDPVVGPVAQIGPIADFSETPSVMTRSAPALGEHAALPDAPHVCRSSPAAANLTHALSNISIIEFGYFYAMPFGITMAASFGARVIKVEGVTGDPMRVNYGVAEAGAVKVLEGKESVALDVKTVEGRKIINQLLAGADVFAFGFRPQVARRLGLDYQSVRDINPRIIYLHASGYGIDGPYSDRPLYAGPAAATSGCYHRQAGYWLNPALAAGRNVDELKSLAGKLQPPVDGDSNAALAVLSALSLALYHQRRTGQGQSVSTSMIAGNAYAYADDYTRYAGKPRTPLPDPAQQGIHALYRIYPALTGWVFVAAPSQQEWERLATTLGRPELCRDQRFLSAGGRAAHDDELVTELTELFAERPSSDWECIMAEEGLAVVEVFGGSMADFTNTDPVLRETGLVGEVEHPIFGPVLRHGVPVKFSETPGRLEAGCLLGQHTDAILVELGHGPEQIAELKAKGVLLPEATVLTTVM